MNTRNQQCCRRIEQCVKTIASSGHVGRQVFIPHMVRLAEDVRMMYSRAGGDLEAAVPHYMRCVSSDCFRAYEEAGTPEAAAEAVQTLVWRTGLLIGLLAAAEVPDPKGADGLASRILHQLTGNSGETLREKSPVCGYGHPVDSTLVNMLDTPVINGAFRALVDFNADTAMGQMLAASIPVTEANFPQLNRIVNDCAARLNIPRPYTVVTNQIPGLNAMTFGSDEEPYIAVTSLLAHIMSEPEMRFVIGHECGHIAMGHVIYHTAAGTIGQFSQMIPLVGQVIARSISYPLNAWSRRSEITADRAGFLCCGDLEQSKRTLLHLESAFAPADSLDLETYMASSERFLEQGFLRRLGEYNANHPLTPKRIRALELFSKSEAYFRASGQSIPADALSNHELARQTENIVKVL